MKNGCFLGLSYYGGVDYNYFHVLDEFKRGAQTIFWRVGRVAGVNGETGQVIGECRVASGEWKLALTRWVSAVAVFNVKRQGGDGRGLSDRRQVKAALKAPQSKRCARLVDGLQGFVCQRGLRVRLKLRLRTK